VAPFIWVLTLLLLLLAPPLSRLISPSWLSRSRL
jgi:hypothetical protein